MTDSNERAHGQLNRPAEIEKRRALRRSATLPERRLWQHLRGRRADGLKFRRQYSVGPYVLDFCCPAARLGVEIDGWSHDGETAEQRDTARTEYLTGLGFAVLRYTNEDVTTDAGAVALHVAAEAQRRMHETSPLPSPWEGEGGQAPLSSPRRGVRG